MTIRKTGAFNLHEVLNGMTFGVEFKEGDHIIPARLALTDFKSSQGSVLIVVAYAGDNELLLLSSKDGSTIYDGDEILDAKLVMTSTEQVFKPYDHVVVRNDGSEWHADIYSHYDERYRLHVCRDIHYKYCLPFKGNESLLGKYEKN